MKYYEILAEMEKQRGQSQTSEGQTPDFRKRYLELTKKCEEDFEKVTLSSKELSSELKLFKQNKEIELRKLMSEFVSI